MINVKDEPRPDPVDDLPWGNSSSFFSEKASAPVFSAVAMWCLRAPAELPMMGEVKEGNKSKVTFGMSELRRGLLGFVKQCCHRVATKNRKSSFKKSQNSQRIFLLHKLFLRLVFSVLFLILFCTFWGFLLNKFLKVKIRNKFASRKGAFLSRNQTLKFARIAKIRKVWQHCCQVSFVGTCSGRARARKPEGPKSFFQARPGPRKNPRAFGLSGLKFLKKIIRF